MIAVSVHAGAFAGLRCTVGIAGLFVVVMTFLSAVKTVVVPRATSQLLTRVAFTTMRRIFGVIAHPKRPFLEQDRILALYAPLTLVLLPLVWVTMTVFGFACIQWGIAGNDVRDAFLTSGSSMLTLGVVFHRDLPAAVFSYLQAAEGLVLVALLISYLPTIYGSFARRETLVGLLDSRAGTPPSPVQLLIRYTRIGGLDEIEDLFIRFEDWFLELEESHTSFAALCFFRSPVPERSWITASGAVLDAASLYLSVVEHARTPRPALCLRSGFLALRRIAEYFSLPIGPPPEPTDPITVTRREFDQMYFELQAAGVPLKSDREQAWADFQGWRVNYDRSLVLLAKMIVAPPGIWSSDRPGPRLSPTLALRKNSARLREHKGGRRG